MRQMKEKVREEIKKQGRLWRGEIDELRREWKKQEEK